MFHMVCEKMTKPTLQLIFTAFLLTSGKSINFAEDDSLVKFSRSPDTVDQVWNGYDPRQETLDQVTVRQWEEEGLILRYVTYRIGTFRGKNATMAGFFGYPDSQAELPALLHIHGGGQRASLREVKRYAKRGYAVLSVNWGGRPMEQARPVDPNTDWGAVDPTQNNVAGYSTVLPGPKSIDSFPSARNNNWFLLTIGCRRGITFLEHQAEVDENRIGVFGHSMGGRLTGLVAGTDQRVRVASPSVGGSGFLQDDFWGIPGSARRVRGNLALFQKTIAGQAYLSRIKCPLLFLSASNDFNAPMECVEKGIACVPHSNKRTVYAVHLNHRFSPEAEVARSLWLDANLKSDVSFPRAPQVRLQLSGIKGIPRIDVQPDLNWEVEKVHVYYGYGRDPRNRFWTDARARQTGGKWTAQCPVFDLDEPLFCLANAYYRMKDKSPMAGDPTSVIVSATATAYPDELKSAGVQATEKRRKVIDDFSRGWHDWYRLNPTNPHHWLYSTRKLADPRWQAPENSRLLMELESTEDNNIVAVQLLTNQWRGYAGKKFKTWTAMVLLSKKGMHRVELKLSDFRGIDRSTPENWDGITELIFQPGQKVDNSKVEDVGKWQGQPLQISLISWQDD